ncbi:ATP-binding protein [Nocardiopsis algeriensis]|uniref:Anti-sigma regulatory factor (Ser/Thr protein kinase) n=1 Tax=Nocardiopsis algeriensis TaxID=1478215 RepID=A0A841IRD6_9ACTN|nr:ATP-binding protein [Nocardiopsis algeriensis]MBB6120682.1 anti-sigma regulatory factor (Ser/Thr protein kinase) [Nocardiopsis algeriensis]
MSNRTVPTPSERRRRLPLRRCSFRFVGRPESVKDARDWLERKLTVSGAPEEATANALLLLSELATNNIRHAPTDSTNSAGRGDFYVRVFFFHRWLRVEVLDAYRRTPALRIVSPEAGAENGRGLFLVNALASRWGRFRSVNGPGVFFELRWDSPEVLDNVLPLPRNGR